MFRKQMSSSDNIALTEDEIVEEIKNKIIDDYIYLDEKCDRVLERVRNRKLKITQKEI